MPDSVAFAFVERGRGKGHRRGGSMCVTAVSRKDAREYAKSSMGQPVLRGKCSGREDIAAVTTAARAVARKKIYPDNPELWGAGRRPRRR